MMRIFVLISILLVLGCQEKIETPYKVKLPVEDANGRLSFQVVELKTLENPDAVDSSIIKIRLNSKIYNDGTIKDQVPRAQYILTEDNVIIPKDATTGQLFALYKNMEDLYFLDVQSGASQVLRYPRTVSLQTTEFRTNQSGTDNSIYNPESDIISFLKTSKDDAIPLALQKSVLSHEHFHAISHNIFNYQKSIEQNLKLEAKLIQNSKQNSTPDLILTENQKWNLMILKVIEEGLADFWAYNVVDRENLYLGSKNNLEHRNVDGILRILYEQSFLEEKLDYDKYYNGSLQDKIIVGKNIEHTISMFSNLFRSLSEKAQINKGVERSRWIVNSLKKLNEKISSNLTSKLSIPDIIYIFTPSIENPANQDPVCDVINNFLLLNQNAETCI